MDKICKLQLKKKNKKKHIKDKAHTNHADNSQQMSTETQRWIKRNWYIENKNQIPSK